MPYIRDWRKILIVDDDQDFVEATKTILENDGYRVVGAANGEEALERVRQEAPVLIILDLMLPDRDGLSLCETLKTDVRTSDIPVLVVTAAAKPKSHLKEIVSHHRVDDYAEKPVSAKELLRRVDKLISEAYRKIETRKTTILIADDDPDFVLSTKRILQTHGYGVVVAKNGEECVEMAKEHLPDMIILDVMLPDKDGYTVCTELKEGKRTHGIPVLMTTVLGRELRKPDFACEVAVGHEADDYADKPIPTEELLKKVRRHTRTARFY